MGSDRTTPGAQSWPRLDERLVEPEGREEMIRGVRVLAAPSAPEHGDPHFNLSVLLGTHAKPNVTGSTDMLTRTSGNSDFASDTSLRRSGIDPKTQERYLEELAFEVVHTESASHITAKAMEMTARGVRRVFALFVLKRSVCEWRSGRWEPLSEHDAISDELLATPLPVKALLNAGAVGTAALRALIARDEPELKRILDLAHEKGELLGKREAIRQLLSRDGHALTDEQTVRLNHCDDLKTMNTWLELAVNGRTARDVLGV
jgi:hypothetical protein